MRAEVDVERRMGLEQAGEQDGGYHVDDPNLKGQELNNLDGVFRRGSMLTKRT